MALRPDTHTRAHAHVCTRSHTYTGTSENGLHCEGSSRRVWKLRRLLSTVLPFSVDEFADAAEHQSRNTRSLAAFKVGVESELIPSGNPGKQGLLEVRPGLQAGDQACL